MGYKLKRFPSQLKDITSVLINPLFRKQGFFNGSILQDWDLIVGESYGTSIFPEKITFPRGKNIGGTLHVSVASGGVALLFEHKKMQVLERINTYYGYEAISSIHIKLSHKNIGSFSSRKKVSLSLQDKELVENYLKEIENEELKQVLRNLGCAIIQDKKNK